MVELVDLELGQGQVGFRTQHLGRERIVARHPELVGKQNNSHFVKLGDQIRLLVASLGRVDLVEKTVGALKMVDNHLVVKNARDPAFDFIPQRTDRTFPMIEQFFIARRIESHVVKPRNQVVTVDVPRVRFIGVVIHPAIIHVH